MCIRDRGLGDLARQRRRGHLAAGHAVNGIVDENHGDIFPACRGMDRLRRADGGQVAVALVGKDDILRAGPLDAGCDGRRSAVGSLDAVAGKICLLYTSRCV